MTRTCRVFWLTLLGVCAMASVACAAGSVTLVREGRPAAVIILPVRPTVSAQLGAAELQWHVRQMTGATLQILDETFLEPGQTRLYLGDTRKARRLGLTQDSFALQEHAIRFVPEGIVFAGKDKSDFRTLVYTPEAPEKLANLPGLDDERGSADAVYDFLEQYCGVRWLYASQTGNVIPQLQTLTVTVRDAKHKASLDMRNTNRVLHSPEVCMWKNGSPENLAWWESTWPGAGKNGALRRNLWLLYSMRWHNGGVPLAGNHSLYGFYDRFCEATWADRLAKAATDRDREAVLASKAKIFEGDRPEFFAQGYPTAAVPPQLCYTSPALIQQLAKDARAYFAGEIVHGHWFVLPNPFVIEPMDNSQFCKCENCQKWTSDSRVWEGYSTGKNSDYMFQFVDAVAREVLKTNPDARFLTLSYMTHAVPPERVKMHPAIEVQYCFPANRTGFMFPKGNTEMGRELKYLDAWVAEAKQSGRKLSLWFYNTFPMESYDNMGVQGFPGFFAHAFADQIKLIHRKGYRGIYHCGWGQDVESYIGFKLQYDVNQDVDALIDEYFTGLYGPAAAPMKQMYLEMEDAWSNPAYRPEGNVGTQELSWKWLGSKTRMARWNRLFHQAQRLATGEREQKNLEVFEKGIWSYMKTGADKYNTRMSYPLQSATIPRVPNAGGDWTRVDWSKIPRPFPHFFRQQSDQPARRDMALLLAYDDEYLYMKYTDPVGDIRLLQESHALDTLEVFTANSRALPYRQWIYNTGPKNAWRAYMQGEINWRMHEPLMDERMQYSNLCPDDKTLEMRIVIPLNQLVPTGRALKTGDVFYMNVVRVSPPTMTMPGDRPGGGSGYSLQTLASLCGLAEMDRLAEFTLGQ